MSCLRHIGTFSTISNHPIFYSAPHCLQAPVRDQLAVTSDCAGNGASIGDIAQTCGISEGTVLEYLEQCMTAILVLEPELVQNPTLGEIAQEKGFVWEGCYEMGDVWYMGDGTLLFTRPRGHRHKNP